MLPYIKLVRLPNVFTSIADVFAGAFILSGLLQNYSFDIIIPILLLSITSACLYANGIIWNDIMDIEIDRIERPNRPLPSGQIKLSQAFVLSVVLMAISLLLAAFVSFTALIVASSILLCTFLYNTTTKHMTISGSISMALCRSLNLALGFCIMAEFSFHKNDPSMPYILFYPLVHFIYIFAVTFLGTMQEGKIQVEKVFITMALLTCLIAYIFLVTAEVPFTSRFVIAMILGTCLYKVVQIYRFQIGKNVGLAIKHCLLMLIPLDAMLATAGSPGVFGILPAMLVIALMIPTYLLAQSIEMT